MGEQATKTIVRAYLSAFNEGDHDAMREYVADGAVQHGIHAVRHGHDEILEYLEGHFAAFPDYAGELQGLIAEDDVVAIRYRASGTHTGTYQDVQPTGFKATWTGMAMYRVEDEQVAEIWLEEDRLGLLEQLELVNASEPAHLRI